MLAFQKAGDQPALRMPGGVVSHADLIKMLVAHYMGTHLDNFQRIVISPASITTLMLGYGRPYVMTVNDVAHVLQMEQERKRAEAAREAVPES